MNMWTNKMCIVCIFCVMCGTISTKNLHTHTHTIPNTLFHALSTLELFCVAFLSKYRAACSESTTATISRMLSKGMGDMREKVSHKARAKGTEGRVCLNERRNEAKRGKNTVFFSCYYWHICTCLLCGRHVFIIHQFRNVGEHINTIYSKHWKVILRTHKRSLSHK